MENLERDAGDAPSPKDDSAGNPARDNDGTLSPAEILTQQQDEQLPEGHPLAADNARISALENDLAKSTADNRTLTEANSKLVETVLKQADQLGQKDQTIEQKDAKLQAQAAEIERLRSENTRLNDKLAERGDNSPSTALTEKRANGGEQAAQLDQPKHDRIHLSFPSDKALGFVATTGLAAEGVAVAAHLLPNPMVQAVVGGLITAGPAAIAWAREKHEEWKNAHQPKS